MAESGVSYAWHLSLADGTVPEVVSTANNPKFFKLDANALDAGEVYELRVVVTDAATGLNNSAATTIDVTSGDVIATIDGGACRCPANCRLRCPVEVERDIRAVVGNRLVSVYDTLVLDANASYDENGPSSILAFAWSCERDGVAVDLAIPSSPVVMLDSSLGGTGLFVFSVNVSRVDGDAASDVAQVYIEIVASTPPRVSVGAVVGRVNRGVCGAVSSFRFSV